MRIVAGDIGGTHARFAIAEIRDGHITLGPVTKLRTADHAGLPAAWRAFRAGAVSPLPDVAALAVAAPIGEGTIRLTNSPWIIRPATLAAELGLADLMVINDFGAMARAVATLAPGDLSHICGPPGVWPITGMISVIGPGTGLGVAGLLRTEYGDHVIETEAGHIDFAPHDAIEDAILADLRGRLGRVSVERVVSGAGLANLYAAMVGASSDFDDAALWAGALAGDDPAAAAALDRFCRILGSVAGDIALAHGARGVAIVGTLAHRLARRLTTGGFAARFAAKGRFAPTMSNLPVKLVMHPEPGLLGAAAAYQHGAPVGG